MLFNDAVSNAQHRLYTVEWEERVIMNFGKVKICKKTVLIYSKFSSNSEDTSLESGAIGESALEELNIVWD
jgi:hypothetical protein